MLTVSFGPADVFPGETHRSFLYTLHTTKVRISPNVKCPPGKKENEHHRTVGLHSSKLRLLFAKAQQTRCSLSNQKDIVLKNKWLKTEKTHFLCQKRRPRYFVF